MKITKKDVGRKVYDKEYGVGIIYAIDNYPKYPVRVGFENGNNDSYTSEGKRWVSNKEPSLSFDLPKEKKRYWIWVVDEGWGVYECVCFLDEEGCDTKCCNKIAKSSLIKKTDRYIDMGV